MVTAPPGTTPIAAFIAAVLIAVIASGIRPKGKLRTAITTALGNGHHRNGGDHDAPQAVTDQLQRIEDKVDCVDGKVDDLDDELIELTRTVAYFHRDSLQQSALVRDRLDVEADDDLLSDD